jgi:hypothetical protein
MTREVSIFLTDEQIILRLVFWTTGLFQYKKRILVNQRFYNLKLYQDRNLQNLSILAITERLKKLCITIFTIMLLQVFIKLQW